MTARRAMLRGATGMLAGSMMSAPVLSADRVFTIGQLSFTDNIESSLNFVDGMQALGYVEGRNLNIVRRIAAGDDERLRAQANELVQLTPDAILVGGNREIAAARRATRTIPIITAVAADPVGAGLVASLARPGGNITGVTATAGNGLLAKRLELLKEIVPGLSRVAVLRAAAEVSPGIWAEVTRGAQGIGVSLDVVDLHSQADFDPAFAAIRDARAGALFIAGQSLVAYGRQRICDFALQNRLPAIYAVVDWARAGLLITFGPNVAESYRYAAVFVDKVLRGASPAELPMEQPLSYQLAVNLKTARAIGVKVPQSVLLRADEVIE